MSYADVSVATLSNGQVVISGGYMDEEMGWMPNSSVTIVDGKPFVKLSALDSKLAKLCGVELTLNAFMDELREWRGTACAAAEDVLLSEATPLGGGGGTAHKAVQRRRSLQHIVAPTIVRFDAAPLVDGEAASRLTFVYEADKKTCVKILLDNENMRYVVRGMHAGMKRGGKMHCRRDKSDFVSFDAAPAVRWNYQRKCAYVTYKDADGRVRTKSIKPNNPDDLPERDAAAALLQAFAP
jgi:hypothetical protein